MEEVDVAVSGNDAKRLKQECHLGARGGSDENANRGASDEGVLTKLFVRNVDRKASEQEIANFFEKFGKVSEVRKGHKCQTTAFVTFVEEVNIANADKDELLFKNRYLVVKNPNGKKNTANPPSENYDRYYDAELPTFIHTLPDETLEHVFSFLNVIERIRTESVCKRWRGIGKKIPWRGPAKLDFGENFFPQKPLTLTNKIISSILSRCGASVREFILFSRGTVSDKVMDLIGKHCPNLLTVKLDGFPKSLISLQKDKSSLLYLAKQCPKLRNVSLCSYTLNDKLLSQFLQECRTLERLELILVNVTGECFDGMIRNLKGFRLVRCQNVVSILPKLKKSNNVIQELGLVHCRYVTPSMLITVCRHYKNTLKVLHLNGQFCNLSEWKEILTVLCDLEELSLDRCPNVGDSIMSIVATKCVKLKVLTVSGTKISDVGVSTLSSAPCLKVLDVSHTRIAGGGIDNLAAQGQLEELYVRRLPNWANDIELGCLQLAKFCPNLRILDLSSNKYVTLKLVKEFQFSVKNGFFQKGTVKLIVGETLVQKADVEQCDGLQVVFDSTSQSSVSDDDFSDGLYSDEDDDGDNDSFVYDNSDDMSDSDDISDVFGFLSYLL